MTIEKQMKREDLVALIREGNRKERIRNNAEGLYLAIKALVDRQVDIVEIAADGTVIDYCYVCQADIKHHDLGCEVLSAEQAIAQAEVKEVT